MLPTPSTSHVNYAQIYEPSEDSYLLLDTLSSVQETAFLHAHVPPTSPSPLVLEVGTGSGVVLAFIAANAEHVFGRADVACLGTDVNAFACAASGRTVEGAVRAVTGVDVGADADADASARQRSGVLLDTIVGDLAALVRPGMVDVLVFNPPYVPSENLPFAAVGGMGRDASAGASEDSFTRDSRLLALSTDGGVDGMEVTDRLLAQLPDVLSMRGVAYVLLCAQNKPEEVLARIRAWPPSPFDEPQGRPPQRWAVEKVGSSGKTAGWENLCVIRIWREAT